MKLPTLPQMPMAIYKRKVFRVAPYTIYHATDGNYWMEHDSGEGMHLTLLMSASSIEWIDKLVSDWRAYMLACNHVRVADGEIPSAQAAILADISANHLRAMLVNAENTRLELAMKVFREHNGE